MTAGCGTSISCDSGLTVQGARDDRPRRASRHGSCRAGLGPYGSSHQRRSRPLSPLFPLRQTEARHRGAARFDLVAQRFISSAGLLQVRAVRFGQALQHRMIRGSRIRFRRFDVIGQKRCASPILQSSSRPLVCEQSGPVQDDRDWGALTNLRNQKPLAILRPSRRGRTALSHRRASGAQCHRQPTPSPARGAWERRRANVPHARLVRGIREPFPIQRYSAVGLVALARQHLYRLLVADFEKAGTRAARPATTTGFRPDFNRVATVATACSTRRARS